MVILIFVLFSILGTRVLFLSKQKNIFIFISVLIAGIATFTSAPIVGVSNIRSHAEEMREMTASYQEFLNQISEDENTSSLLIIASKDADSEPAAGTQDFLLLNKPYLKTKLLVSDEDWMSRNVDDITCVILGEEIDPPTRILGCNKVMNFNMKYFPSY